MKVAMGVLGFGALFAGFLQIPGVTEVVDHFLEPTFEDSPLVRDPPVGGRRVDRARGRHGALRRPGSALAYYMYVVEPGDDDAAARALPARPRLPAQQVVLRRALRRASSTGRCSRSGASANSVFERVVVQGIVGGTVGLVRGANALVRSAQSGFVRAYALLVVAGFACLGLYFLIVAQ